ncbi:MAG TPA: hypothetical protein VF791_01635 [Pyrinomonadaceae bacterium]
MTADERLSLIRLKVERAKKHIRDFEVLKTEFIKTKPYTLVTDFDPHTGYNNTRVTNLTSPPVELGLIAGDAIHNLRSALEHLARQLVLINGGTPTIQTGFPVWEDPTEYRAQRNRRVQGMKQSAIDAIDATEPYNGGKGTGLWVLHDLDIADKHHALLVTLISVTNASVLTTNPYWWRGGFGVKNFALPNFGTPLKDGDVVLTCDPEFQDNVKPTFDVALVEHKVVKGKPLLEGLHYLSNLVDSLILSFRDELI